MATIPSTRGNPQATDVAVQTALPMVGSASREDLQATLAFADAELAKLFEDRNILLVGGGTVTFTGTDVQFTEAIKLHINSKVAGGSPTIVDLAATTRTISANNRMIYAVVNRGAGTATVTDDSATLPAVTSANQEVILIAKRVDDGTGVKRLYFRNGSAFNEGQSAPLGSAGSGSGGGGKNYIKSPDSAFTNWASSGAGVTVSTSTTLAELPEQSKKSGIKIIPVSGTDYAYTRFTIDRADKLKTLGVTLQVKSDSSYADDDLELQVWTNTLSDYTGTYIQLALDREAGIKKSDNGNTQIWAVSALDADYYEVRIKRNAGTDFIVTSGVTLGPDTVNIAPVVTDWIDYTATFSPGLNVASQKVRYRIVGTAVQIQGRLVFAGTGTGTNDLLISLPPGMSISTTTYPHGGGTTLGTSEVYQAPHFYAGLTTYQGLGNDTHIAILTGYAAANVGGNEVRVLKDPDLNAGDNLTFEATVQIQELAGKGTVQIGPGPDVEYASNYSTSDADDTTSFAYGQQGSQGLLGTGGTTSLRIKHIKFQHAIQPGDNISIEIDELGIGSFVPIIGYTGSLMGGTAIGFLRWFGSASGTNTSGIGWQQVDNTTIGIHFGHRLNKSGDGDNSYTGTWNDFPSTARWRVKKVRAGALVGIKKVSHDFPGLLPATSTLGRITLEGGNGYGSVGNAIRRFDTVLENLGTDITYVDDVSNGASFTINVSGIYSISYSDLFINGASMGLSLNSPSLTLNIAAVTGVNLLSMTTTNAGSTTENVSVTYYFSAGDIIRAHTDGSADASGGDDHRTRFKIIRLA